VLIKMLFSCPEKGATIILPITLPNDTDFKFHFSSLHRFRNFLDAIGLDVTILVDAW